MTLTPEQQAAATRIVDAYVQIGLSTQPIDREAATAATLSLYGAFEAKRAPIILHVQSPFASTVGSLLLERMRDKWPCPQDDEALRRFLDETREELAGQISGMDATVLRTILQEVTSQIQCQMSVSKFGFWPLHATTLFFAWARLSFSELAESEDALVIWKKNPTLKEAILHRLAKDRSRTTALISKTQAAAHVTTAIHSALDGIDGTIASGIRQNLHDLTSWSHQDLCETGTLAMLAKAQWLCDESVNRAVLNRPKLFHAMKRMVSEAGRVVDISYGVAISDHPAELHLDARQRPHRIDGPAILYRDGWTVYAIHGVVVPREIIDHPSSITVARIDEEKNIEVRRVLIERYGLDRYMKDSQAELLHRDATGLLYRKQIAGDEPIVMIRVLNSTPEPDGVLSRDEALVTFGEAAQAASRAPVDARFKEYMIRVPPEMTQAHEAVAWTFGLTGEEYYPALET